MLSTILQHAQYAKEAGKMAIFFETNKYIIFLTKIRLKY